MTETLLSDVTLVIPAYNEADSIAEVVRSLRQAGSFGRVLVVDDGSCDGTGDLAADAGATVVAHEDNRGYGASLATGIESADTAYVLFADADGQHDPADVVRVAGELSNWDMVVGARTAESHVETARRPGKRVLRWFANFLTRRNIPDVNSGLRGFRREVILQYLHLMPDGFSFSTTSTLTFIKSNRRIHWVPIRTRPRVGKSTVRQMKHGPQTLLLMLRLTVLFEPMRVFLPVSAGLMAAAVVMTVLNFVFFRWAIPQTAVFFGLAAVIIFMLSLVIDQVSAMRRELHERF
jgi:glycosyltransferase involved in cell wall biosynthesis